MAQIRDLNTLLGLIGDGRAIAKINQDFPEVMKLLIEASNDEPRKKHKASITLQLTVIAEGGVARLVLDVKYKTPPKLPEEAILWLTKDGHFSNEHPRQINMFPDRERTIEGGRVIDGENIAVANSAG